MKKIIFLLLLANIASFWVGRMTEKPIVKTVEKEVKFYDFSQEPKAIEMYANYIGKTLSDKKEIKDMSHKIWQEGYMEGYKEGGKRCIQ